MQFVSFFNESTLKAELDTPNGVCLLHDLRPGKTGLRESKHYAAVMSKKMIPENGIFFHELTGSAMLMFEYSGTDDIGIRKFKGTIAIKTPENRAWERIFLCPLCGCRGPFEAYPTLRHAMKIDGSLIRYRGAKPRNWDETLVYCPDCSFHDQKFVFDTSRWCDLTSRIKSCSGVPI